MRRSASIGLAILLSAVSFGQSAATKPAFDIADVHVSPRGNWTKTPANSMQGGFLNAGRYALRRATMLDLDPEPPTAWMPTRLMEARAGSTTIGSR